MDVGVLEVLLDSPDVVIASLVELPVDDCVAVCVDELCPCVLEKLVDCPDVEEVWLMEPPVDDCVAVCT